MVATRLATTILALSAAALIAVAPAAAQEDGGPDTLEVTKVSAGKKLNIRTRPSLKATILGGAPTGTMLKNMGCKTGSEGRWCNVELDGKIKGWSFGDYLKEAAAEAPPAPVEAAAPPAKPAAYATGKLPCSRYNADPTKECEYGVLRYGPGKARLMVLWPDSTRRMFGVYEKAVSSASGKVEVTAAADGALTFTLNAVGMATERYTLPADVITPK